MPVLRFEQQSTVQRFFREACGNKYDLSDLLETPYPKAPEICIEIVSPSTSKAEITDKVDLYLAKDVQEIWMVYEDGRIMTFSHIGEIEQSTLAPDAQKL